MKSIVTDHLLTWIVLLPLIGAVLMAVCPRRWGGRSQWVGGACCLVTALLWFYVAHQFRGVGGFEFSEFTVWQEELGLSYWVAIDGISIFLIGMTVVLIPLFLLMARVEGLDQKRIVTILIIESAVLGAFVSLDFFLFFIFFELAGVATYFLIGFEGSREGNQIARTFLIFNLLGSAAILLCLCFLTTVAEGSLNLAILSKASIERSNQILWGSIFIVGLGLKIGLIPFHIWLRQAHGSLSPCCILVIASIPIKVGLYALIRFAFPLFPEAMPVVAPYIALLGTVSLLGGGFLAIAAPTLLEKIAYVTIGHMGLITMGVALLERDALQGALYHMVGHGLMLGAIGILVVMGMRKTQVSPQTDDSVNLTAAFLVLLVALGFPGTSIFVGFFMILMSAFQVEPMYMVLLLTGWVLLGGALFQWFQQSKGHKDSQPLTWRVAVVLLPLLAILWIGGIVPGNLIKPSEKAITASLSRLWGDTLVDERRKGLR